VGRLKEFAKLSKENTFSRGCPSDWRGCMDAEEVVEVMEVDEGCDAKEKPLRLTGAPLIWYIAMGTSSRALASTRHDRNISNHITSHRIASHRITSQQDKTRQDKTRHGRVSQGEADHSQAVEIIISHAPHLLWICGGPMFRYLQNSSRRDSGMPDSDPFGMFFPFPCNIIIIQLHRNQTMELTAATNMW
jgi:hypothetical protein